MTNPNLTAAVLKPCPFCGESAVIDDIKTTLLHYRYGYRVRCGSCHQHAVGEDLESAKAMAIAAWNRRDAADQKVGRPLVPSPADAIRVARNFVTQMREQGYGKGPLPAEFDDLCEILDSLAYP